MKLDVLALSVEIVGKGTRACQSIADDGYGQKKKSDRLKPEEGLEFSPKAFILQKFIANRFEVNWTPGSLDYNTQHTYIHIM